MITGRAFSRPPFCLGPYFFRVFSAPSSSERCSLARPSAWVSGRVRESHTGSSLNSVGSSISTQPMC